MRGLVVSVLLGVCGMAAMAQVKAPDFGPNVDVFSPKSDVTEMEQKIDTVYSAQQHSEFGTQGNTFLFLPGQYHVDIPIGFYTRGVGWAAPRSAVRLPVM